jgi:hypothetical protein
MIGAADTAGYRGPATLRLADDAGSFEVQADLRGMFEPIDGRYHWYGRLAADAVLAAAVPRGRATGTLSTLAGTAECELSDPDPWLRYRISGLSTPPFGIDPADAGVDVRRRCAAQPGGSMSPNTASCLRTLFGPRATRHFQKVWRARPVVVRRSPHDAGVARENGRGASTCLILTTGP